MPTAQSGPLQTRDSGLKPARIPTPLLLFLLQMIAFRGLSKGMISRDPFSGCLRLAESLSGRGSGLVKSLKNNASFKAVSYLGVTKDRPCWSSMLATIVQRSRNFSQDAGPEKQTRTALLMNLLRQEK